MEISAPEDLRPAAIKMKLKILRRSAGSGLSKRVLGLIYMFGAAFGNSYRWRLPYAAPNKEVRRRSVSQRGTCRWNAEKNLGSGIQTVLWRR